MMFEEIKNVFLKKLGYNVLSVRDSSKGVDQNVKIVTTDNGVFVLKIPHKENDKILKEYLATSECIKLKLPVPKVIYHDKNILIETYLEGKTLEEVKTNKEQFAKIYFKLGRFLRKIHSIKCDGFGSIMTNELRGKYSSQKKAINSYMVKELINLKNSKYYSNNDFIKIKKYYAHTLKNSNQSVLLHSDFEEGNILIKNNDVSAIIDFGDLSAGPPMQDFTRMYTNHYGTYKFDEFIRGYGTHDIKDMEFYTFCFLTWRIASYKNRKDKLFKRMIKIYEGIWRSYS
jgi:aminoglycoside phosphotransferase (APT) family kinase protein